MSNHQEILDLARTLTGNENLYSVQPFIRIAGDTIIGLFLERVVYWSDRSGNDRLRQLKMFYKSAEEWEDELGLSYAQVTRARKELVAKGFIQTNKRKIAVNGPPTMHYYANMEAIKRAVIQVYQGRIDDYTNLELPEIEENRNSENSSPEVRESRKSIEIQESETSLNNSSNLSNNSSKKPTSKTKIHSGIDCLDSTDPNFSEICRLWQANIGFLSPLIADEIKAVMAEIPPDNQVEWFREAITRGCAANARQWRYVRAILLRWIAAGGIDLEANPAPADSTSLSFPDPILPDPAPLPPHAVLWQQATGILRGQMTRATYDQIIGHLEARASPNGKFVLAAPDENKLQVERLSKTILQALRQFKPDISDLEVICNDTS